MSQTSTKPPSGTRDFLPDDMRRREHVMRVVRDVYESYGFEPLETPAFENIETLLGMSHEPGHIDGYGPICAEQTRDIARARPPGRWHR